MKSYTNWKAGAIVLSTALSLQLAVSAQSQDRGFSNDWTHEHYPRTRICDIVHIKIEPRIDIPGGRVDGLCSVTLTPLYDSLSEVVLDAVDMQIKSVQLESGIDLDYTYADNKLTVTLNRDYDFADTLTIVTAYQAHPKMGLYFIRPDDEYPDNPYQVWSQGSVYENSHWFPCWDYPNDRATSEIITTVDDNMMAIGNGALIDSTHDRANNQITYHWREDVPHVSYLISLIIGEYHLTSASWDGIPINYYVYPPDKKLTELAFGKTPDMMRFFSEKIGVRYPYEKYSQTCVHDFIWGGMENISATTMTRYILHDERAELDYQADALVSHELAHQWWGDLLTTKDWNNMWLNEGFAEYFENLYIEHDRGFEEFRMKLDALRDSYFAEDKRYRRPIVTRVFEEPTQMYDAHTYRKGALVLHMLHSILGDKLWWKGINLYAARHREQTVETADFRQAMEDASGRSLGKFFDQWIFRAGYPEYEVSWKWNNNRKMAELNVKQTQAVDSVTPLYVTDVELLFTGDFGKKTQTIEISKPEQTLFIPLASRPDRIEFDPDDIIIKKLKFKKTTDELIGQLRAASTISGRIRAAKWLADVPQSERVVSELANAVGSDPAWGVRRACARTLGDNKSERSRKALIDALDDTHSEVRRAAALALGKHRDQPAVTTALQRVFTTDLSYRTQAQALKSLAKLGAPRTYKNCLDALKQSSYREWLRAGAFEALIELEDKRGIDHAFKWSTYGRPTHARTAAIKALGKLAEFDKKRAEKIRERLESLLDDPHHRAQSAAIGALKSLGSTKSIPALARFKEREIRYRYMKAAREAIAAIQKKAAERQQGASVKKQLADLKQQNEELQSEVEDIRRLLTED